jgi:hypothetical protein
MTQQGRGGGNPRPILSGFEKKKAPGQGGLTERRKRGSCATSGGAEQTAGGSADRFSD